MNFLQHVVTLLKPGGRAAVIVPDNVLFESGAAATIRRRLLETCDVHTLLRLPTGLFYAQGVKANVLFFDRGENQGAHAKRLLWIYDLRQGNRFSLKTNPLQRSDLDEFLHFYRPGKRKERGTKAKPVARSSRWRAFEVSELLRSRLCNLDLIWKVEERRDGAGALSRLDELSQLISADLQRALEQIAEVSKQGTRM